MQKILIIAAISISCMLLLESCTAKNVYIEIAAHDCEKDHTDPNMPIHDCPHHLSSESEEEAKTETHDCDSAPSEFSAAEESQDDEAIIYMTIDESMVLIEDSEDTSTTPHVDLYSEQETA